MSKNEYNLSSVKRFVAAVENERLLDAKTIIGKIKDINATCIINNDGQSYSFLTALLLLSMDESLRQDVVKYFFKCAENLDVNKSFDYKDNNYEYSVTPLSYAVMMAKSDNQYKGLVEMLLAHDKLDRKNPKNAEAFVMVCANDDISMYHLLNDKGVDQHLIWQYIEQTFVSSEHYYNPRYLYVDDDNILHVMLPFARGAWEDQLGIITDNTCAVTKEMQDALSDSGIISDLRGMKRRIDKLLTLGIDESKKRKLVHLSSQVDNYLSICASKNYLALASKADDIYNFSEDINVLLFSETSNFNSMVLSPKGVANQDPFVRSKDPICSFSREKYLPKGSRNVREDGAPSAFRDDVYTKLLNTPFSILDVKGRILHYAQSLSLPSDVNDTLQVMRETIIDAESERKELTSSQLRAYELFSKEKFLDAKTLSEKMTYLKSIGIHNPLLLQPGINVDAFVSDKIASLRQALSLAMSEEEITDKATTALKYKLFVDDAYREVTGKSMSVNALENMQDKDYFDMSTVLATLHSDDEWDSFNTNTYLPFHDVAFVNDKISSSGAEDISILTQFFIGVVNIQCYQMGMTRENFGKILDAPENDALRSGLVTILQMCYTSRSQDFERNLIDYIADNYTVFGITQALDDSAKALIIDQFRFSYGMVKDIKEKDEFFIHNTATNKYGWVEYAANVCCPLAKLVCDTNFGKGFDSKEFEKQLRAFERKGLTRLERQQPLVNPGEVFAEDVPLEFLDYDNAAAEKNFLSIIYSEHGYVTAKVLKSFFDAPLEDSKRYKILSKYKEVASRMQLDKHIQWLDYVYKSSFTKEDLVGIKDLIKYPVEHIPYDMVYDGKHVLAKVLNSDAMSLDEKLPLIKLLMRNMHNLSTMSPSIDAMLFYSLLSTDIPMNDYMVLYDNNEHLFYQYFTRDHKHELLYSCILSSQSSIYTKCMENDAVKNVLIEQAMSFPLPVMQDDNFQTLINSMSYGHLVTLMRCNEKNHNVLYAVFDYIIDNHIDALNTSFVEKDKLFQQLLDYVKNDDERLVSLYECLSKVNKVEFCKKLYISTKYYNFLARYDSENFNKYACSNLKAFSYLLDDKKYVDARLVLLDAVDNKALVMLDTLCKKPNYEQIFSQDDALSLLQKHQGTTYNDLLAIVFKKYPLHFDNASSLTSFIKKSVENVADFTRFSYLMSIIDKNKSYFDDDNIALLFDKMYTLGIGSNTSLVLDNIKLVVGMFGYDACKNVMASSVSNKPTALKIMVDKYQSTQASFVKVVNTLNDMSVKPENKYADVVKISDNFKDLDKNQISKLKEKLSEYNQNPIPNSIIYPNSYKLYNLVDSLLKKVAIPLNKKSTITATKMYKPTRRLR